jgi:hypothetical protein
MSYLIRFDQGQPNPIAHLLHEINGVTGALCSQTPKPAVGDESQKGKWQRLEALPAKVRLCTVCQKIRHKLNNPLPERVEQELALMAKWDEKAAARQREKMLAHYRRESEKIGR